MASPVGALYDKMPTRELALVLAFLLGWLLKDYLVEMKPDVAELTGLMDTVDELEDRIYELSVKIAGVGIQATAAATAAQEALAQPPTLVPVPMQLLDTPIPTTAARPNPVEVERLPNILERP